MLKPASKRHIHMTERMIMMNAIIVFMTCVSPLYSFCAKETVVGRKGKNSVRS